LPYNLCAVPLFIEDWESQLVIAFNYMYSNKMYCLGAVGEIGGEVFFVLWKLLIYFDVRP